jgi:hypothetical protein
MIPQRNISLISNTLVSAGGRRIPSFDFTLPSFGT